MSDELPDRPLTAVEELLSFFQYLHLPPFLQEVSQPFADLAEHMRDMDIDGREFEVGLRKLIEAKDCIVRARLMQRRMSLADDD